MSAGEISPEVEREFASKAFHPKAHTLPHFVWTCSDQLERTLGKVDWNPKTDAPNKLQAATSSFMGAAVTVVLLNHSMLQRVLDMLTKKDDIKLSGDGTHKLTHEEWVFITLGALTKHYSADGKMLTFRTTYAPLAFIISNAEGKGGHDSLFDVAIRLSALWNAFVA